MRLRVQHKTVFDYVEPISYSVQAVRMSPQAHDGMAVLRWSVRTPNRKPLPAYIDGYGNLTHALSTARPHETLSVSVEGEVETREAHGIVRGTVETLPPGFYLRSTPLTAPSEAILALIAAVGPKGNTLTRLHRLMNEVHRLAEHRIGLADAAAPAMPRRDGEAGQDHPHAFIAAARLLGCPTRYVSGYLWTREAGDGVDAGHAWAEAFVEDLGWVGFDPANGICPTEAYIRCAIGLDYWSASPARSIWRGAEERLSVRVRVDQIGAEQ